VAALDVQPNKGALYESNGDHEVSFEVSAGGKSISTFMVKHKTFTWSSTSEPAGKTSRWCPDMSKRVPHFGPSNFTSLIGKDTSCETVAKAIKAGKVTPQTSAPPLFATPGWT
jgi:hypothetical protein